MSMTNGECPIGAAHSQQIRLLEENIDRIDHCVSLKADSASLARIETKVDKINDLFWALVALVIANLVGIILMLLKTRL